ncbi:unnamed protein product [Strongylus vulgaris]|uniref:Peptidase C1A papain C-terminal domain-containing protein n=1 Tax=Strongylus vulgaris TaxID=40348 RepID=A0A3P7JF33_STRVU|nr:unnamed protein product [Strongylus vulgaris]
MTDRLCIETKGKEKCLANCAISLLERSPFKLTDIIKVHISDTDLLSCCGELCGRGCHGGLTSRGWLYFTMTGICTGGRYAEKDCCKPYAFYPCGEHKNQTYYGPCPKETWPTPKCRKICQLRSHKDYKEDKIFGMAFHHLLFGYTFRICIFAKVRSWLHKWGEQRGAHAIKIIGWGVENGTPYWLIANSWNTDWGEKGYFRILRGENHCGIEEVVIGGHIDLEKFE